MTDSCAKTVEAEVVRLYQENADGLFRYAYLLVRNREAAQDAVQEIFLRYFSGRMAGSVVERPKAWLFQVLRNHLLDGLKAAGARTVVGLETLRDWPDSRQDPESDYRLEEMARRVWALLSPRELECFRLRAEGLRYDEIADVLSLRAGTVGALLARVQKKVRRVAGDAPARSCLLRQPELPHAP